MSTSNFCIMANFPLFVAKEMFYKVCPCCDEYQEAENETCESCGESLEAVEAHEDELYFEDLYENLKADLDEENGYLLFHTITVRPGYYSGLQLYVEELDDPNDYDNESCHYYWDCCRSLAIRKYERELRKVERIMRRMAKRYGMDEYYCSARFSNGEALYSKVPERKAGIRQRVKYAVAVG